MPGNVSTYDADLEKQLEAHMLLQPLLAMKLPVDLTTRMWAFTDRLAKVSSLLFMSTVMGNFMICLGSMDEKDIFMNVTALAILVITVIVNVCVQIIQMRHFLEGRKMFAEEIAASISMLLLLVMVTSSAIMIPATKRYLESKYHEMMKTASDDQILESMEEGNITFDKLSALIFILAEIREVMAHKTIDLTASKYGWSIKWIVLAQSIGVAVGTIAPAFRCCTAIKLKCYEKSTRSFQDEFKIDAYWTQRLVEWKESSLPLQIRNRNWRKTLHCTKGLILNFVIRIQIFIVLCSKVKVIAANSMYRICERLLRAQEGDSLATDEGLFEQLSNMIANIMAACFTNLMRVIIMKCHRRAIKDNAKSVREAALLLGETEEILRILEQHRAARSDPDESEYIKKWCGLISQKF
ncbi:hypothetical protein BUALT_Bualt07G0027700 [Buddleja alternifolia]|uniref:Odorant receptor n=1 Tax=Buddleja alternifolia TaxID=168488 RepID=A0AAV6X6V2_9LAMI|nr:hypothetical protein BUALT_Bualt07G0027700 [Buddleja alternifolia]